MNNRLVFATLGLLACTPEPEESPFEGPGGSTEVITESDQVLVAMTHLRVRNLPGPGGRFGDHAEAIGTWLYETEPDGWLGASFRNVGQLDWWTVTVWESEEAMMEFVLSDVHAQAMGALTDVAAAAESRHEWMDVEDAPPSWESIVSALQDDPGFVFVR